MPSSSKKRGGYYFVLNPGTRHSGKIISSPAASASQCKFCVAGGIVPWWTSDTIGIITLHLGQYVTRQIKHKCCYQIELDWRRTVSTLVLEIILSKKTDDWLKRNIGKHCVLVAIAGTLKVFLSGDMQAYYKSHANNSVKTTEEDVPEVDLFVENQSSSGTSQTPGTCFRNRKRGYPIKMW